VTLEDLVVILAEVAVSVDVKLKSEIVGEVFVFEYLLEYIR